MASDRELVVYEWRARPRSGVCGQRVVDGEAAALAIDQTAEVALAEGFRRDGDAARGCRTKLVSLVGEEEERPVASTVNLGQKHRATQRRAKFVANQVRRLQVKILAPPGHAESTVPHGLEDRPMNFICARLRREHEGPRPIELRRRVVGLRAKFGNGVQTGWARGN